MASKYTCPNKANHVSATPASDRERCPYCKNENETPVYVKKRESNPFYTRAADGSLTQ